MQKVNFIKKPWGSEEILEKNEYYVVKRLTMNKGHRCSLQFHEFKKETIFVLEGKLKIYHGLSEDRLEYKNYKAGDFLTINPKEIHRMEATETSVYLESSTPQLDDVIRIVDDYER